MPFSWLRILARLPINHQLASVSDTSRNSCYFVLCVCVRVACSIGCSHSSVFNLFPLNGAMTRALSRAPVETPKYKKNHRIHWEVINHF